MNKDPPEVAQPSWASMINWLRANLALTVFITGLLSGLTGTLVTTTQAFDNAEASLTEIGLKTAFDHIVLGKLQTDMIDVDRRVNVAAAERGEERRTRDADIERKRLVLGPRIPDVRALLLAGTRLAVWVQNRRTSNLSSDRRSCCRAPGSPYRRRGAYASTL